MTSFSDIDSGKKFDGNSISYTLDDAFYSVGAHDFATDFPSSGVSNVVDGDSGLASAAMALWSNVADITFTSAPSASAAQIGFMESDISPVGMSIRYGTTLPYYDGGDPDELEYAGIFVNKNNTGSSPYQLSKAFTYLHELGHALGLQHPNGGDGSDASYNMDFTIMSTNFGTYTSDTRLPVTPMLFDIAAIQSMYGANFDFNDGNTDYTFTGGSLARTIWDGGGTDSLDASSETNAVTLDLRTGFDGNGDQYVTIVDDERVFIAYHADIENAKGGSGNDTIYGNDPMSGETVGAATYSSFSGENTLDGGGGADTIFGYGGDDLLIGAAGADEFTGGEGDDIIVLGALDTSHLAQPTLYGDSDTSQNIVNWAEGDGHDTLVGFKGAAATNPDILNITGLSAAQFTTLIESTYHTINLTSTEDSSDKITIVQSNNSYDFTESETHTMYLNGSSLVFDDGSIFFLEGEDQVSNIAGTSHDDQLIGSGSINDTFLATAGSDRIDGLAGTDTVSYTNAAAAVTIDLDTGSVTDSRGNSVTGGTATKSGGTDILVNIENITGSDYDDSIVGTTGINVLNGGTGNDYLYGDNGNDTINGGAGSDTVRGGIGYDTLTGNGGADTFLYLYLGSSGTSAGNRDIITDFSRAEGDKIDISTMADELGQSTNTFIGTGNFTGLGTRAETRYATSGGNTIIGVDADGDGNGDWQIQLTGTYTLIASDFVL